MILSELYEALDKAVDYDVSEHRPFYFQAEFVSNGRKIVFDATSSAIGTDEDDEDEDDNIRADATWELAFVEQTKSGSYSWDATGSGKEFEVLATIRKILTQFLREYKPKALSFTSDKSEPNRARLYARLFGKLLPSGYKLKSDDTSSARQVNFLVVKE